MKRPLIGEYMSKVTDVDGIVEGINDYYASQMHLIIGKPIDVGRLFYVRLHSVSTNNSAITDYEVVWNHKFRQLVGMLEAFDRVATCSFLEIEASARQQRRLLIDQKIEAMLRKLGLDLCLK